MTIQLEVKQKVNLSVEFVSAKKNVERKEEQKNLYWSRTMESAELNNTEMGLISTHHNLSL